MPQVSSLPQILASARTAQGVAFQLRKDPRGILEVPELENVLISVHVGSPAKLACRRGGKRYSGAAVHGDIDIIPAHTPSRWEMKDENDTALLVSLPQTLLRTVAEEFDVDPARLQIRNRFQIRDAELEALCWATKREMELSQQSGRLYLDGLALAVASRLVAQHSSVGNSVDKSYGGLDGRRLKQVLSFIEERLEENLSLHEIAAVAGISSSHLNALFRKSMTVPLHQYVIRRRLERAKMLLARDGMSMAQVALAAGFTHQSHMAKHMRRVLGIPPRAMKRLLREASTSR